MPIRFGSFPTAAEAQHAASLLRRVTHRGDDVRWLFLAARTRRAGGHGESQFVELDHPTLLAIRVWHQRGNGVPQSRLAPAYHFRLRQRLEHAFDEPVAPPEAQLDGLGGKAGPRFGGS